MEVVVAEGRVRGVESADEFRVVALGVAGRPWIDVPVSPVVHGVERHIKQFGADAQAHIAVKPRRTHREHESFDSGVADPVVVIDRKFRLFEEGASGGIGLEVAGIFHHGRVRRGHGLIHSPRGNNERKESCESGVLVESGGLAQGCVPIFKTLGPS